MYQGGLGHVPRYFCGRPEDIFSEASFFLPCVFRDQTPGTRLDTRGSPENLCSLREDLKGLGGGSRERKRICCVLGTHKGRLKEERGSGGGSLWKGSGGWDNMKANQSDTCMEMP